MTNAQNRKRWAIAQQKAAQEISKPERAAELAREAEVREFQNMYFGNLLQRTLRGEC